MFKFSNFIMFLLIVAISSGCYAINKEMENEFIWRSVSSGTWKVKGKWGYYKVLVMKSFGRDHSRDKVLVQIIERTPENNTKILSTIKLDSPGYKGYIDNTSFHYIDDETMALYLDIEMKGMEGIIMREIYILSPNGKAKLLVKAESVSIYSE